MLILLDEPQNLLLSQLDHLRQSLVRMIQTIEFTIDLHRQNQPSLELVQIRS